MPNLLTSKYQKKMGNFIETGHAKNVANFDKLLSFIAGYGANYNPSKSVLKLAVMQALSTNAKNAVGVVNSSLPANNNAIAARDVAFAPLAKLATRIMNAIIATDTTEQIDDNVKTLIRKLQGKRAKAKKTEEEKQALAVDGVVVKENSSSQMSFDTRVDTLDKLIKLLATIPQYAPNEVDIKVTTLTTLLADLKAKNLAVVTTLIPLSNARIIRNDILQKPLTGLVDIALDSKTYIKSLYGATSPQYKQVSKLQFKVVPN